MKDKILRKILQIKFTNIEDRETLSKIQTDKTGKKLIERAKIAVKEIINEFEKTLETINEIIYTAASVITEKLNYKSKHNISKRIHKQPHWKSKIKQEMNAIRGEVSIIQEIQKLSEYLPNM